MFALTLCVGISIVLAEAVHTKYLSADFIQEVVEITWKVNVGLQRGQAGVTQSPQLIDCQPPSTPRK